MRVIPVSDEDAIKVCKLGQQADCCIWLVAGSKGFECIYYSKDARSLTGESIKERWEKGLTVAKRDGCDKVK